MDTSLLMLLLSWLPAPLLLIAVGAASIFFLSVALRLIAFILDLIPFL